jgi:hypothetical protein
MSMTEQTQGKYLYAIINATAPASFETKGIGGRGDLVHTITEGQVSAVVSDSPMIEYDNTRRNMMAHTLVLEEVMQRFVMLPVRFGTIAPDTQTIATKVLRGRYDELTLLLEQMRGRVELGLKASWHDGVIFPEIIAESTAIRTLRDSLVGRSAERTHFDRVRLGELIAQALERKRTSDEQLIHDRLRGLVHKTRLNKTIGEQMVLNAAYLVEQPVEPELDAAIRAMDAELGERFRFKYVGPVPPYNFVNIVVNWG